MSSDKKTPETGKHRPQLLRSQFGDEVDVIQRMLNRRLDKKGLSAAVSIHEIYGVVLEEVREFESEVHDSSNHGMYKELVDIAVACIFGMASLKHKTLDW